MGSEASESKVCSTSDLMASKSQTVGRSSETEVLATCSTVPEK